MAQGITAVYRVVSDRIDATADYFEPLKTNRCQRRAQGFSRHHGAACKVVEFFEIRHDGLVQKADAVVRAVALKISPVISRHRQLQVHGSAQSRPAQGPLGSDVDNVRSLELPQPNQGTFRRNPHAQVRIVGDRKATHQDFLVACIHVILGSGICAVLAQSNQLNRVVCVAQTFHHLGQRHGNAIDFRRVSFRYDSDAQ